MVWQAVAYTIATAAMSSLAFLALLERDALGAGPASSRIHPDLVDRAESAMNRALTRVRNTAAPTPAGRSADGALIPCIDTDARLGPPADAAAAAAAAPRDSTSPIDAAVAAASTRRRRRDDIGDGPPFQRASPIGSMILGGLDNDEESLNSGDDSEEDENGDDSDDDDDGEDQDAGSIGDAEETGADGLEGANLMDTTTGLVVVRGGVSVGAPDLLASAHGVGGTAAAGTASATSHATPAPTAAAALPPSSSSPPSASLPSENAAWAAAIAAADADGGISAEDAAAIAVALAEMDESEG